MPPDCDTLDPAGRIRLRGIKGRNVFRQMLNSSSIRHTVNMKLLLLAFVVRETLASGCLPPAETSRVSRSDFARACVTPSS